MLVWGYFVGLVVAACICDLLMFVFAGVFVCLNVCVL